jgi:hypothetical protein
MFTWSTMPTFSAALLFWLLAAYILTRGARNAISLAAVIAVACTAAFLLGEAMEASAPSADEWMRWARGLRWAGPTAATAWYWLSALLVTEQESSVSRRYLHLIGYPVGLIITAAGLGFAATVYVGDLLWAWSDGPYETTDEGAYLRFSVPGGRLNTAFIIFIASTALLVAGNLAFAWRLAAEERRHRRFTWLLVSAILFVPEVGSLSTYYTLGVALPTWFNHLALACAMAVMATNVAAYHHLRHGRTIRLDLLYFLTSWLLIGVLFVPLFVLAGGGYSFRLLALLVFSIFAAVLVSAVAEPVRRLLDRLFFGREVQQLRSNLALVAQDAGMTSEENLGALLKQAQAEIAEVSREHLIRVTEEALRRLSDPAALAQCQLIGRLPRTLAAAHANGRGSEPRAATPLEQAQALREVIARAVDRLKPPDRAPALGAPESMQYHILREEYLLGLPNNQIMTRHSISEGTFHRNRRRAIAVLADELSQEEERQPVETM